MLRIVLLCALFCAGCGADLTPPGNAALEIPGPHVAVAAPTYNWTRDSAVVVIARNPDNAPVYYGCSPVRLQRYRDGWQDVPLAIGGLSCGALRLSPADSLSDRLPLTNDYFPRAGWYRVLVPLYRDSALTQVWSESNRSTAPFEVRP